MSNGDACGGNDDDDDDAGGQMGHVRHKPHTKHESN